MPTYLINNIALLNGMLTSFSALYTLVQNAASVGPYCADLALTLMENMYPAGTDDIYVTDIPIISKWLNKVGFLCVYLSNGSGNMDQTYEHYFILTKIHNLVYRVEAYAHLYCARIVVWPLWRLELGHLLSMPSGADRIAYWNSLFSSAEHSDTHIP